MPNMNCSIVGLVKARFLMFLLCLFSCGSMDVEKKEETLVYDSVNFFAAVGGNLGLFLGFSCLSIVYAGIDLIVSK